MKIIDFNPQATVSPNGFTTLATFDAEVSDGIRVFGLELVKSPDGKYLIYTPSIHGRRVVTFRFSVAAALADAAVEALRAA